LWSSAFGAYGLRSRTPVPGTPKKQIVNYGNAEKRRQKLKEKNKGPAAGKPKRVLGFRVLLILYARRLI